MAQVFEKSMETFLAGIERRAYRMAVISVGNSEDALDIVQDTMLGLVKKYAQRPQDEWTPLFYRILQSRINDWHRRNIVRNRWRHWFGQKSNPDMDDEDAIESLADPQGVGPEVEVMNETSMVALEQAIAGLPARQQQAFMLRIWEGLSVIDTAKAMGCSEGSVKTHYSRAIHRLRSTLEEHWQ